jgi:hypothetical protein
VNSELEKLSKEVIVAYLRIWQRVWERLRKPSVRVTCPRAEIWKRESPNRKQCSCKLDCGARWGMAFQCEILKGT